MNEEKNPCISCGNKVPDMQSYPYPGHKASCELVGKWIKDYLPNPLTDEDFLALESAKSMCHGGGSAAAMAASGEGKLNPLEMHKMLRVHQLLLQKICDKLGGWDRLVALGGPQKLTEMREQWENEYYNENGLL